MLINIRVSELQDNTNNSLPLAIIIGIYLNYILFQLLPYDIAILNNYSNYLNNLLYNNNDLNKFISLNNNNILFVSSKIWDGNLAYNSHITSIGNIMYTKIEGTIKSKSFLIE